MIRFTTEYTKLSKGTFTTIRKNSKFYRLGSRHKIRTPEQEFEATIVASKNLKKADIDEKLAKSDADCTKKELIEKLEKWYGKKYDDYVLLILSKNAERIIF